MTSCESDEVRGRAIPLALRRAQDGGRPDAGHGRAGRARRPRASCCASTATIATSGRRTARRDAPLWEEEVVEVFLAPGADDPTEYVEIEVNPLGADLRCPRGQPRRASRLHAGRRGLGRRRPRRRRWTARFPARGASRSRSLGPISAPAPRRASGAANFFRIERPRDGAHEFSCWSPTLADPPDFHKPGFFGRLILDGG